MLVSIKIVITVAYKIDSENKVYITKIKGKIVLTIDLCKIIRFILLSLYLIKQIYAFFISYIHLFLSKYKRDHYYNIKNHHNISPDYYHSSDNSR